jgi:UDP-3-O-[3-hydroxymyristoyl] glucosamine N-acyltransferase
VSVVVRLADYLQPFTTGSLAATEYGQIGGYDLAHFLARWPDLHSRALTALGAARIHPSAVIHPTALIGDDVIIGPGVHVHEFSSVRGTTVLAAGVSVGFNCEVTSSYLGQDTVLGHRVGINRTLLGSDVHLSANVTIAAINLCTDMRHPDREVLMRHPDGLYRCHTTQFGALIGNHVQSGNNISLGPGIALGEGCRIDSGITLAARIIPAHHTLSAPHTAELRIRQQRLRTTDATV